MVKSEQKRKAAATVCILQHIHCETPGIILDCLQSAGIEMRFVRTFERNPIPSNLDTQAGLIRGAFIMGLRNGNYCVVCCWALMSLMFVAGVMSLLWMAVIAAFVLVEKVAPGGQWVSRISGLLLILWGAWMLMGVLV